MPSTTPDFSTDVSENMETKILQVLADTYPNLDCGPGTPVYEMVVRPIALLWSRQAAGATELLDSVSFENYRTMDEAHLDRLMNRYFLTRRSGSYVTGVVRVVFGSKVDVYIRAGEIWEASNNRTYEVLSDHFVTKEELPGDDINGYYVDVAVRSTATGQTYNAVTNDAVTVTGSSASSVRRAYFLSDTSDGGIVESNYVFYNRGKDELAQRGLYSYKSVKAILRDNFRTIQEVVPIGIRDNEMIRDLVNIRGTGTVHIGGKCDIYVRTNAFKITSGYQAPLGFPMSFNGYSLASEPEQLMQAWNAANLTPTDTALRGSVRESVPLLTPASPMTSLTSDITAIDDFVLNSTNELLHTDNLVKQMWPLVFTASITVSDTESAEAIATVKSTIAQYVNELRGEDAPQVAEIAHLIRDAGVMQVHLPIDVKCYYLTEDLRMERIGLDLYRQPVDSILRPTESDSLTFIIEDRSQISLRTCCWYTNEDLINVTVRS